MLTRAFGALALALSIVLPQIAVAQDAYPTKPIRMIVNGAAGGVTDIPGRLLAEHMRVLLGQPIVVESNGGGGGIVGAMQVKNAPADGYTIGYFHGASHGLLPAALKKNMPFDALEDFIQVFQTVRAPFAFIVPASRPYKTLAELVEYAKGKPDGISYGTPGIGNSSHLIGLIMAKQYGVIMKAVHYRGESLAAQDVAAGVLDWAMVSSAKPVVDSGQARAIATSGDTRWFVFPDVPTLKEQGVSADVYAFNGIMLAKGTPQVIVDRINAAANEALKRPGVREKLQAIGFEPVGGSPAVFRKAIVDYIAFAKKLGQENNLSID